MAIDNPAAAPDPDQEIPAPKIAPPSLIAQAATPVVRPPQPFNCTTTPTGLGGSQTQCQ
jgi:hypothetical protein